MLKVDVLNSEGKKVNDIELTESIFGVEINEIAVHAALVNFLANQRQGTQSTKTRSEVSGGGRKPWKQKGTGRARQGSIRATQWIKGGIALGPKPRSYRYSINKKMKQLAFKSVLTSKLQEGNLIVVDNIELKEIKTKNMVNILNNLNANNALIMLAKSDVNVQASARNIEKVKTTLVSTMNIYDLLKYNKLIVTVDAIKALEEVYA
ncbi:50S ribosomal protein L4 [Clostridium sp. CAG:1219]|nr:50S ribosomal protein L4 [Clostridium sp. CAG:1219]